MKQYFLTRIRKSQIVHIYYPEIQDTACRMASTGGLKLSKYKIMENSANLDLCQMCSNIAPRFTQPLSE